MRKFWLSTAFALSVLLTLAVIGPAVAARSLPTSVDGVQVTRMLVLDKLGWLIGLR